MAMKARTVPILAPQGFVTLAYWEWEGPPNAPTVMCVHGLTRNGRDFEFLAEALARHFRVVCPDMPGRGRSEWLSDAKHYGFPLYLSAIAALLARLDVTSVHWVGTSMGGLIGMMLASLPKNPVRRLVLNDVGPVVAKQGLARIGESVGKDPAFSNRQELDAYLRKSYAPFGPLTDEQWRHLTSHGGRTRDDGRLGLAYDPKIGEAFRTAAESGPIEDFNLSTIYERIEVPTLVIRGSDSDLLRAADAQAMTTTGPKAQLVELSGIGHAPALMEESQIAIVRDFLLAG